MDEAGYVGGEQSLISPFHEGSSVALELGRVKEHSRSAFSSPGYLLQLTKA